MVRGRRGHDGRGRGGCSLHGGVDEGGAHVRVPP
ncbi:hypothetical protein ACHAWF_000224, partial [Thalassiosira exigua]